MLCSLSQVAYSQGEIRVNQIGYCQDSPKWAMVADIDAKSVTVCNANDGKVVLSNVPVTKSEYWKESGENIQWVDFSALKTPGRYFLQIGETVSFPFEIKQNSVYDEISLCSLSTSDYTKIEQLIPMLFDWALKENINVSLPTWVAALDESHWLKNSLKCVCV